MAEDKAARSARNRRYYVKRMEQAQQPEPPREHVKIGPNALGATGRRAASSEKGGPYNPFQPYAPAPGVVPKGHDMAMDAMDWGANDMPLSWAQQGVMGAAYTEGMEFLGYPQLAAMAQRSEYRVISETLAEEMTRRWIKFEATGDSDDGDSDASLDKDDQDKLDPDQQDGDDDQEEDAEQDDDEKTLGQDAFPQQAAPPAQKPAQPGQPAPPPAGPPAGLVNPANPTQPAAPKPPDPEKKARDAKQDKITKIEAEFRRLQVRDRFKEIAEHDGFFGRSHLYIDTGAGDDADELASNMGDGRDDISKSKIQKGIKLGLRVIEPVWTYPTRYESSDPLSPRWYKPDGWLVMGKTVHSSRLLTFVGREVPDLLKPAYSFGGLALTQMAKPYVENWLKVRTGVTKAVTAFSVFVLGTDQNMMLAPDSDEIFKRATLFNSLRDNNGLMMIDKETETFANVSMSIAGLEGLQAQAQEHMASVCKIPLVKLLGISPTGLNASSEGEMRCFNDSIHAYQERFFRPNLERLLGFVQLALFGEVDPEITFEFEHLYEPTDMERAEIRKTDVEADQILVDLGVLSPLEVRTRIASDDDSPYAGLSDDEEDLPDLSQEEQQGLVPGKGAAGAGGAAGGPKPPGATPPNPMAGIMGAPAAQPPGAK